MNIVVLLFDATVSVFSLLCMFTIMVSDHKFVGLIEWSFLAVFLLCETKVYKGMIDVFHVIFCRLILDISPC